MRANFKKVFWKKHVGDRSSNYFMLTFTFKNSHQRRYTRKAFLKISQNSQENACTWISFNKDCCNSSSSQLKLAISLGIPPFFYLWKKKVLVLNIYKIFKENLKVENKIWIIISNLFFMVEIHLIFNQNFDEKRDQIKKLNMYFKSFTLIRFKSDLIFKCQPHKMGKYTQTIRQLQLRNFLSVFDHFVGLPSKGLIVCKS